MHVAATDREGGISDHQDTERAGAPPALPRALVTYASRHGSTEKVAEVVAVGLRDRGFRVDVVSLRESPSPEGYDAVVVGGPMIIGWHRAARRFVARRRDSLARVPTAYFMTAMALTDTGTGAVSGVPVFQDPWLGRPPADPDTLRRRERYAAPEHYLGDVLRAVPEVRPRSVAFFGGALDLTTMSIFERLFVMLAVGATPGDARNWSAIGQWSRELAPLLLERP